MHVKESIQVDDEVTVVIKGIMDKDGWNAITVTDNVEQHKKS